MITYHFIGVDVSKDKFDVALLQEAKTFHKVFDNSLAGFKAFVIWFQKYTKQPWVCMEATGHYSEPLADFLSSHEIRVSVINPLQIKHFAKATLTRNKNDKVDSQLIAHYGSVMSPMLFKPRTAAQKNLRESIQLMDTLKLQRTQLSNQLHSYQSVDVRKEIQQLISSLEKRIIKIQAAIEQQIAQDAVGRAKVDLLTTIKGVGKLTAYQLLAYLPDLSLFQNAKQLAAFMGLSPRQKMSGRFVGKTCLSKFGNPRLRKALYMPALSVSQYNTHLKPFITRLQQNGLKPKAIIGAIMRKLVHIIFGMIKNNKPFDPALV
jgi:transposase